MPTRQELSVSSDEYAAKLRYCQQNGFTDCDPVSLQCINPIVIDETEGLDPNKPILNSNDSDANLSDFQRNEQATMKALLAKAKQNLLDQDVDPAIVNQFYPE